MIFKHSEKDYQDLQKTNWKNINYLNGKIEKLEKELAELQTRKDLLDVEYIKLEKENKLVNKNNVDFLKTNCILLKEIDKLHAQLVANRFIFNTFERHKYLDKIEDLQEENGTLKQTVESIKTLDRQEVEKIFNSFMSDCIGCVKPVRALSTIDAICNLAVSQIRTSPFTDEQNEPKGGK